MTPPTPPQQPDGRETRSIGADVELRFAKADGEAPTAAGYAILFNSDTQIGDMWRERFMPGAFTKSLAERDVLAVHSHDRGRVVGRTGAGTLTLREDERGVAFVNPLPDTTDGRDLAVQIKRGDVHGMSFAFSARRETWDETTTPATRTIFEADLFEITYTSDPQYDDTTVALRSLEHARSERRDHNKAAASIRIAARRARQAQVERKIH